MSRAYGGMRFPEHRLFAFVEHARRDGCETPAEIAAWLRGRRVRHQGEAVTVETVSRILADYSRSEKSAGGSRIIIKKRRK